jgi:nitroreductase
MRRLRPDPVPDAIVRRLVKAANCAPSGRNVQRARWIVVRDPEQRRRIADVNRRASLAHATSERDSGRELPHHDRERRRRMWDAVVWQAEHMHEAPAIIVACCIMDDPAQDPGRYASSIWPGVQNLLLAARASGLGAVPTTYALEFRDELEALLDLPPNVRAQAVIPVGFPVGTFGPVRRLPVDEVMMADRWAAGSAQA